MRSTLADYLTESGFSVITAKDGADAVNIFEKNRQSIDLVLLDVMMPNLDGYDVLKIIRERSDIPVIMLSAREREEDQLKGFHLGADNYITKPFLLSVLKEQIKSCLSRVNSLKGNIIEKGDLTLETEKRKVFLDKKPLELTPKEYDVLNHFIENEHRVLSRESILDAVWGIDYYGDYRTVDTIIKQLRKKLGAKYNYIHSVYGVGYYFEV